MEIDLNHRFKDNEGEVIKERIVDKDDKGSIKRDTQGFPLLKEGKPFTLRKACINALDNVERDEKIDGEEKYKRGKLIASIMESDGTLDLKAEDITLIKKQIGKTANPSIVYQAFQILDPPKKEVKEVIPKKK